MKQVFHFFFASTLLCIAIGCSDLADGGRNTVTFNGAVWTDQSDLINDRGVIKVGVENTHDKTHTNVRAKFTFTCDNGKLKTLEFAIGTLSKGEEWTRELDSRIENATRIKVLYSCDQGTSKFESRVRYAE